MSVVIGLKYVDHDAAAFVLSPGQAPFGLSRERITRRKHDIGFPYEPLEFIRAHGLAASGDVEFAAGDRDLSTYWRKPYLRRGLDVHAYLKGEEQLKTKPPARVKSALRGLAGALYRSPVVKPFDRHLARRLVRRECQSVFPDRSVRVTEYDHHTCHAAGAYHFSHFNDCAVVTLDGIGDNQSLKVFVGQNGALEQISQTDVRASIGHVYTSFTEAMGFIGRADEGKVEALACFGNPDTDLYRKLRSQVEVQGLHLIVKNPDLLKRYPWEIESIFRPIVAQYGDKDTAAAIQRVLEEVGVELVQNVVDQTGKRKVAFSGGVFANVKLNLRVFEQVDGLDDLYVFPAMGDDGNAAGSALLLAQELGWDLSEFTRSPMPYFGPEFGRDDIQAALAQRAHLVSAEYAGEDWPERTAQLVFDGNIVATYQGRMEFGPRALGNRSILTDPRSLEIKERLNLKVKRRKWFQPLCPSILETERSRLFAQSYPNKHMTCAFRLKPEFHAELPAVTHVDGTARPQFVEPSDNPKYYRLIREFQKLSGYGVVLNTSFNMHGRAMVMTPADALQDFLDCGMDYVVLDGWIVKKKTAPTGG